ncbi:MAG: 4-hydroxythreonine-4-phosphate dehydrogenase PdxA [Oscillibacter sp.]|jgi:4-hydroxythreonine-4-phosphate dehydrogenase|nr:4-hydroxythreonine-4-phosphate dehydrogenase PdxA [Oscillibacter sp.]
MSEKPVLGVLLGNSAGVGPELVAALAVQNYYKDYCHPVIIGDLRMFEHALKVIGTDVPHYVVSDPSECDWDRGFPIIDLKNQDPALVPYGKAVEYCGKSDLEQMDLAIELCKSGKIEGFVFGPFHKGAMKMAGMHVESEHTYLAEKFHVTTPYGEINMMDDLMTVRTTSHIPLKDVSANLTEETLREAITLGEITGESFGSKPRMAVAALNPHCGEFGLTGREEVDIIAPTVEKVVMETGWNVSGPYSADTLFIRALNHKEFDVVVTLYHDQGQIALKLVGFERCITVAGGQPYPIATCAHGTAFDKVGTATATTTSFERAVKAVSRMAVAKRQRNA